MALNARQRRFVEAYTGDAKAAAIAAGYSPRSAAHRGYDALQVPEVAAEIKAREQKRRNLLIMDREQRQMWWTSVIRDEAQPMKVRLKASELLARSDGDFIERHRIGFDKDEPLQVKIEFVEPAI